MEDTIIKKVELENNQTLIISDASRKISEDAYVVKMKAKIDIDVEKDLFSAEELKEILFEDIKEKLGEKVCYEYVAERNFIISKDKDALLEKLVSDFFTTPGKYVAKAEFPKKFLLKQYKDITNKKTNTIKAY